MKRSDLYKYPRNILIPLALFIIVIGVVMVLYRFNSLGNTDPDKVQAPLKVPVNTKSDFNVDAQVIFDQDENSNATQLPINGVAKLNIDIASGAITIDDVTFNPKVTSFTTNNIAIKDIDIKLNHAYKSIGNLDVDKGNMDISLNTTVQFNFIENNEKKQFKSDFAIPLKGSMDKQTGIITLKGEATLPPDKLSKPIPLTVKVIADTIDDKDNTSKSI